MARELPLSLADVRTLVRAVLDNTRPVGDVELDAAINFGYGKAIRALRAARSSSLTSYVDPFSLSDGVDEYDIGRLFPILWYPTRLTVRGVQGSRSVTFKYRAQQDLEFEARDLFASGLPEVFVYDILAGAIPGPSTTLTSINASLVQVVSTAGFVAGDVIHIPGAGQGIPTGVSELAEAPSTYVGRVRQVSGPTFLDVYPGPQFTGVPSGTAVTVMRRRVLKIAPIPRTAILGRLYYAYKPSRLVRVDDRLDWMIDDHSDMIVHYALAQLLRAVNDADAQYWFEQAQEMRSELIQDVGGGDSGQNTEHLNSDLWGTS